MIFIKFFWQFFVSQKFHIYVFIVPKKTFKICYVQKLKNPLQTFLTFYNMYLKNIFSRKKLHDLWNIKKVLEIRNPWEILEPITLFVEWNFGRKKENWWSIFNGKRLGFWYMMDFWKLNLWSFLNWCMPEIFTFTWF